MAQQKIVRTIDMDGGILIASAVPMANGDTSDIFLLGASLPIKAFMAQGTPGAGLAARVYVSNDGTNFSPSAGGVLTAAGFAHATLTGKFAQFRVTGGDGTTSVTLSLFIHPTRGS